MPHGLVGTGGCSLCVASPLGQRSVACCVPRSARCVENVVRHRLQVSCMLSHSPRELLLQPRHFANALVQRSVELRARLRFASAEILAQLRLALVRRVEPPVRVAHL